MRLPPAATISSSVIPDDVHATLVTAIYEDRRSILVGPPAVMVAGLLCAWHASSLALPLLSGAVALLTLWRLAEIRRFRTMRPAVPPRAFMERWERRYMLLFAVQLALIGTMCGAAFAVTGDELAETMMPALVLAYLAGIAGRDLGNPEVVWLQTLAGLGPATLGIAVKGGIFLAIVPIVIIPFAVTVPRVAMKHRRILYDSILRAREAELAAIRDPLTGLLNRTGLRLRMEAPAVAEHPHAVLFVDPDGFKAINDTLGHERGDRFLKEVADRLRDTLPPAAIAARFGGDEFAVIVPGGRGEAFAAAEALISAISRPCLVDGQGLVCGASIGIALSGAQTSAALLMKQADTALYASKADGKGCARVFEAAMEVKTFARRRLETGLRQAIADGALAVAYQPQWDVRRRRFVGCEALVRWADAERGPVAPEDFVPLAEETGLVAALDRHVLTEACRTALGWPAKTRLACNLSARHFGLGDPAALVGAALAATGLPAHRLEIELGESILMARDVRTEAALAKMRALGVAIVLDDFGSGIASLSRLGAVRLDKIKIGRRLLADVETDTAARALVKAIAALGADLGIRVAAGGVETEGQMRFVAALPAIDEIQGFLLARPQEAASVSALFAADTALA